MALKIYYQEDCDIPVLKGHKVTIIGYGSQGHAHMLNLKDSGVDVYVGLYKGSKPREKTEKQGLTVKTNAEAAKWVNTIMALINDELRTDMYKEDTGPSLNEDDMLTSAHGFSTHFGLITSPEFVDVTMITPKAPGHTVCSEFLDGKGAPILIMVEQDATGKALEKAFAYGTAIGDTRAGLLGATYRIGTRTDLFDEQAILCGGVCALMQAGFDTLAEAGYDPRSAYFECIHEMKLIVDLIYQPGFESIRYSISNTVESGDYVSGPKLITDETRKAMKKILSGIRDRTFVDQSLFDISPVGRRMHLKAIHRKASERLSESAGKEIKKFYNWNNEDSKLINN